MDSSGKSEAEGVDVSDFLEERKADGLFEELIDTCDRAPREYIRERFEKKFGDLKRKTEDSNRLEGLPDKEKLWRKLLRVFKQGFRCDYCGRMMMISDPTPRNPRSFSLEHKQSIDSGGDNSLQNLTFVCTRCNNLKGTMSAETFREFISPFLEGQRFLDRVYRERWPSIIREQAEREEART